MCDPGFQPTIFDTAKAEKVRFMKEFNNIKIIGLDNGYGNLKTANGIFAANVVCYDHEPAHAHDVLVYNGKYYVIGDGHREFIPKH